LKSFETFLKSDSSCFIAYSAEEKQFNMGGKKVCFRGEKNEGKLYIFGEKNTDCLVELITKMWGWDSPESPCVADDQKRELKAPCLYKGYSHKKLSIQLQPMMKRGRTDG